MSSTPVPIKEFRLALSDLTFTGHDLVRPESILARPDGTLFVSDGRGGVTRIDPDGSQHFIGGLGGEPNGLALLDDDSILVANIGTGGIQKLSPDGRAASKRVASRRGTSTRPPHPLHSAPYPYRTLRHIVCQYYS